MWSRHSLTCNCFTLSFTLILCCDHYFNHLAFNQCLPQTYTYTHSQLLHSTHSFIHLFFEILFFLLPSLDFSHPVHLFIKQPQETSTINEFAAGKNGVPKCRMSKVNSVWSWTEFMDFELLFILPTDHQ